jgi:hypothetical protein
MIAYAVIVTIIAVFATIIIDGLKKEQHVKSWKVHCYSRGNSMSEKTRTFGCGCAVKWSDNTVT